MHLSPSYCAAACASLFRVGLLLALFSVSPANAVTTKTLMDTLYLANAGNVWVGGNYPRTQKFAVGSEDVRVTTVTARIYDFLGSVTPFVNLCDQSGANCQTFTATGPITPGLNTFTGTYTALAGTTVSVVFHCTCSGVDGYGLYFNTGVTAPGITGPTPNGLFHAKAEGELLPAISALSVIEGPVAGGTSLTLTGAYLSDVTDVKFGAISATSFTVVDANTITAVAPAQAAGTVYVTATTPSGTSVARAASRYTYVAAPVSADASSSVPYGANKAPISLNLSGGAATSLTVHASPTHGTLAVLGASVSYTPTTGYAGADSFTYSVSNIAGSSMTATQSIMVASPTISFSPTAPANASFGATYSHSLNSASGGKAPYTYLLASGALPGGLSLSSSGLISGTPTAVGTFLFVVSATDSSTGAGPFSSQSGTLSLTVTAPTLNLSPATLPNAIAGVAYNQAFSATGATAPYSYQITSGSLPAGLTLSSVGVLTGSPTAVGSFSFTVQASDANAFTGSRTHNLVVLPPALSIAPTTLPNGSRGTAYSQTLTASGGNTPYTFAITSGSLPPGMNLTAGTGVISGTPTQSGSYAFTVFVTDSTTGTGAPFLVLRSFTLFVPENSYTAPTSTGTGMATASFTGGGTGCTFTQRRFVGLQAASTAPPAGYAFPQGMFDFVADGCVVDSSLTMTLTYPSTIPANAVLMKFNPNATPQWFPVSASIQGNTITYTIRDGEAGDDDGVKNGRVVDPVALAVPLATASIPTLSEWALMGLALLLAGLGIRQSRRLENP